MIDHLSIQCADVKVSAAFYDAVLATIGGRASLPRARADGVLALDLHAAETEVAVDLLLRRGDGSGR